MSDITTSSADVLQARLSDIDIPDDRARHFDPEEAAGLAAMIAATGLQHPVRLRAMGNRYRLVSGRKRLEAVRLLGWEAIPYTLSNATSDDEARLEEVMENLGRIELSKLDRCQHLYELKQVHQRRHPEVTHGGDRKSDKIKVQNLDFDPNGPELFTFTKAVAERLNMTRSAIFTAVKIWKDLTPDSRKRLAGSRFSDHQSSLKELSEQSPADQLRILDMLLSAKPSASTVAEAVAIIASGVVLSPSEKKAATVKRTLDTLPAAAKDKAVASEVEARLAEMKKSISVLSKFFADLKDDELDSVIDQNEERIIASLKRRGRI